MIDSVEEQSIRVARVGTSISLNTILRNQLVMLRKMGYDVVCVCDDDEWANCLRDADLTVLPLGMGRRPNFIQLAIWTIRFYRLLRQEPVDIVHTVNAFHGIGGRLAARLAGVPIVIQTVHNWYYLETGTRAKRKLFLTLERLAGLLSDRLLFINRDDYMVATERRIVSSDKRVYIGNGIDVADFQSQLVACDRTTARESLGLAPTDRVVVMVARLEAPKDHSTLLRAFVQLLLKVPDARLVLAGHGLRTEEVKLEAAQLGMTEQVRFLGYCHHVAPVLQAADVAILISHHEGFGRVLVEGMVAGRPVVGSDVVGIRDVVRHGETGLLVPPRNPDALAAALQRLLIDESYAEWLACAGQAFALEQFDERRSAEMVHRVYQELLISKGETSAEHGTRQQSQNDGRLVRGHPLRAWLRQPSSRLLPRNRRGSNRPRSRR